MEQRGITMTARIRGGEAVLRGAMALDGTVKQGKGIAEHDIVPARHISGSRGMAE